MKGSETHGERHRRTLHYLTTVGIAGRNISNCGVKCRGGGGGEMHRDTQTEIITQVDDGGEFVDSGISWYKLICKRIARTDGRRHTDRQTDKINRQLTLLNDHTSSLLRILTLSLHRNKVCHFISSTRQGLSFFFIALYARSRYPYSMTENVSWI